MGLMDAYNEEIDRTQRRADQRIASGTRRINQQNEKVTQLSGELDPLKAIISYYNDVQVPEYNTKVGQYNSGWYDSNVYLRGQTGAWMGLNPMTIIPSAPAGYQQIAAGPVSISGVGAGTGYRFNRYTTPVAPDSSAASNANTTLTGYEGQINDLNASGEQIAARNAQLEQRTGREVNRLTHDIELNQNKIKAEATGAPQVEAAFAPAAVFDGVDPFKSIADWLRA